MVFFKKQSLEDERITHIKNKIYAEVYILISVICLISIVVKHFIYDSSIEGIATELTILFLSAVYYMYRSTRLGVVSAEIEMHDRKSKWSKQKKNIFYGVTLGIGIALFFGINSAVRYAEGVTQSINYFLVTSFASLLFYLPFFLIILVVGNDALKKNSDKAINKMLDDSKSGDKDEKY